MKVIVDRFETEYAVVELPDRTMVNLARALLPGAQEGDTVEITVCPEETVRRKQQVEKLMKDVWQD
jgi:hypothetical protein